MQRGGVWLGLVAVLLLLGGCGAKTGLLIPDGSVDAEADVDIDVDIDADPDVDLDADPDVEVCEPQRVAIDRRRAEVMFVVDRSASMAWNLDGSAALPGDRRWDMLSEALGDVLVDIDHLIDVGAKFFPLRIIDPSTVTHEEACTIDDGIELPPEPGNTDALLGFFVTSSPNGGTPTRLALLEARDYMVEHVRPDVPQFIVLATDGGPNCNSAVGGPGCTCTGMPEYCSDPLGGYFNCLDTATLAVVVDIYSGSGIPVYVVGIDDPRRSDLADYLDEMAVAGGRPRPEPSERRFYSIRRPGELQGALETITSTIALCVFTVRRRLGGDPRLTVLLDGEPIRRDPTGTDGWDWSDPDAGELTLFGAACELASIPETRVRAELSCLD